MGYEAFAHRANPEPFPGMATIRVFLFPELAVDAGGRTRGVPSSQPANGSLQHNLLGSNCRLYIKEKIALTSYAAVIRSPVG
jgi:hypothetical protein